MKRNLNTIIIGALLLIIFALLLFVFQVRQSEVAILTTFGKPTARSYDQPGAYFKWPWPIQKVYKFDKRIQNFEDKFTEGYTADKFTLMTKVYVGWSITDPKVFYQKFHGGSVTEAENNLEGLLDSAKKAVVGKHDLTDFVSAGGTKLDEIETNILASVQSQLQRNDYGLKIEFLGIKKIGLPESVTEAVFERMKSERAKYVSESQNKGEADAQNIRSFAERQAAGLLATANAEATHIKSLGEKAATESLLVFQQNPQLAGFLLRLDALELSTKERTTLIFDQHTPPFDVLGGISTNLVTK
jgi:membrane protease subunit HflC